MPPPAEPSAFTFSLLQPPSAGLNGVLLAPLRSAASRLEQLARDASFHFHPTLPRSPARLPQISRLQSSSSSSPSSAVGQPPAAVVSTASVGEHARALLRNVGFDLGCTGLSLPPPSSAPSSPRPCAALDAHPALSLSDGAFVSALQRGAKDLERLLSALKRARSWSREYRGQLIAEAANDDGEGTIEALEELFGPDLEMDILINGGTNIGMGGAEIGDPETVLNAGLNRTTIRAANAILLLVAVCEGGESSDDGQDGDDEDRATAALLVRAARRSDNGKALRFVTADSAALFKAKYQNVFRFTKPDWVLVSGQLGSFEVIAAVESKPKADRKDLTALTIRRLDPLSAAPTLEQSLLEQQQAMGAMRPLGRRGVAPVNYAEGRTISRREELQDLVAPPKYGYGDSEAYQRLLLQLASQLVLCNVRHGMLWAGWGQLLLPVMLTAGDGPSPLSSCSIAFAPQALHASAKVESQQTPAAAEGAPMLDGQEGLGFHGVPNVIMALVEWALYVRDEVAQAGGLLPEAAFNALPRPSAQDDASRDLSSSQMPRRRERGQDQGGDKADKGTKRRRTSGRGAQPRDGEDLESLPASSSIESRGEGDHGRRKPLASGPNSSPPSSPARAAPAQKKEGGEPTERRTVELSPFARGRFAQVHRGVVSRPGAPDVACVYKLNRTRYRVLGDVDRWDRLDDDEVQGVMERFEAELDALEALESLQGSVVPRLLGVSHNSPIACPGDAPAIILEDVGLPIDWWSRWPQAVPVEERRRLVQEAYAALHQAGWLHGDVAPRNVLFSAKPKQGQEDGYDVRICLVDFARARPRPADPCNDRDLLQYEQAEVASMLGAVFPTSA